ncbi:hypothetical protein JANAI62_15080 [Jannaschia pagri]|uniref:DUF3047 domain-containing protein n=1 Tax=Jannaschia pagri TaxID=2829797 RepID=A0ABQ4NKD8_9RHOB|nr:MULTISPECIES: DUF3047 domain-containing protein [unclassified Jannaschia]GIT91053.1 hypothetical protein JANAI61_15110 [Jannaschia sp. AI_61]GIT94885.1 hypothetical protein JANAI62_15080 [Jannaschia sp. AI_62]
MTRFLSAAVAACLTLTTPALAAPLSFDGSWREQGFLRLTSNDYVQQGGRLQVTSDGTVSLLWKAVPDALRQATQASWSWSVSESVPATDLRRKGGDDRNLAVYFAWTDAATAASANPNRAGRLLRNANTRVLVYVWGDDDRRGTVQQSPYLPGLRTIVLRSAGTGQHSERIDLAADYARAFGGAPQVLVGVGVSADSDDTDTRIRASITAPDLR